MSTIRPLATIAILAGLGLFLAHKINQSPIEEGDQLTANWGDAPAYAPATPGVPAPPLDAAPPVAQAPVASPAPEMPGMPPLPATPELPSTPPPVAQTPVAGSPIPGMPAPQTGVAAPPVAGLPVGGPPPVTQPMDDIPLPDDIPEANLDGLPPVAQSPVAQPPVAQSPIPGAAPAPTTPPVDPYQSYEPAPQAGLPPAATPEITPEFPAAEPGYESLGQIGGPTTPDYRSAINEINQALARDELTRAHTMLSAWYGDPSLSPQQREEVNSLLSQLAGTVVYSTDHRLEPPYTVKPGDTLETIAQEYNVPWRLLAKINGAPSSTAIQAGQTLKVLRGPFQALVNATSGELVLMIDGKYAGKFAVQLSGAAMTDGQWKVDQKPTDAAGGYGGSGKQLVLKDASGMGTLVIGAAGGSPLERGRLTVAAADLEELHDILSVGSDVVIRR